MKYALGFCFLFIMSVSGYSRPEVKDRMDVLYINSYHYGYDWSDAIQKGVLDTLRTHRDIRLYIEYLDTKRRPDLMSEPLLIDLLKRKYERIPLKVIIASDDNALILLTRVRDKIFPGVPVVFCGINNLNPESIKNFQLATGVNETADIEETVELMLKLHPGTNRILAITDCSESGAPFSAHIKEVARKLDKKVNIVLIDKVTVDQLRDSISSARKGTLILFTFFFIDTNGKTFDFDESYEFLVKNSSVPIYTTSEYNVVPGILGGKVVSGYLQGKTAGEMALRILDGETPADILIQMNSPNRYVFEYSTLIKQGIPVRSLPQGSIILNRPPPLLQTHLRLIIIIVTALTMQAIVILLLINNIRNRQKAEAALRISERNYREIFNAVSEAILLVDKNGIILDFNDSALSMYHCTREQMAKTSVYELTGEDLNDSTSQLGKFHSLAISEGPQIFERQDNRLNDGSKFWVEATLRSSNIGGEGRLLAVVRDISERKRIEEELRINEQQLHQAQKLEAIGKLAGGIAHDFNNQLTGILGFANLLQLEATDETTRSRAESIVKISLNAAELVKGLLTFARKNIFAAVPTDMHEVIQCAVNLLRHSIDKRINIVTRLHAAEHVVLADSAQMEGVLLNLAFNSRDAMPDGGTITISTDVINISTSEESSPESFGSKSLFKLSVSDTGQGLSPEAKEHLFEPFFTTKERGKGTGLGLASVYGLVKTLNGSIDVESLPGKGTVFTILIPLVTSGMPAQRTSISSPVPAVPQNTILLADDEKTIRESMAILLRRQGHTVMECADGAQALEQYREHWSQIDLVILDMVMPKMGGREAFLKMKEINKAIKVLGISGYNDHSVKEMLEAGMTGVLNKPFTFKEFSEAIKKYLFS